jgi:protein tyrosine phosphatase (PTP) superfamily phosphohydrolase (DUF442 family)
LYKFTVLGKMAHLKVKNLIKFGLIGLVAIMFTAGGWVALLRFTGNIHEINGSLVLRSAQLAPEQLAELVQTYQIKTVLNLRGEHKEEEWYRAELAVSEKRGVTHENLALSATHEPDDATLKQLIQTMKNAQTPLLIHCEAGADRSGLAAALYRLAIMGDAPEIASRQLSFRYGHFPWLWSRTGAMDRAFWRVVAAPEVLESTP